MTESQQKEPRQFNAEFFDSRGRLDHNMTGTVEDIFAASQGRRFIITGEVKS